MLENEQQTGPVDWLTDHPGLAVPVLYLLASAIGVFYYWVFFGKFGINFIEFADASDFLVLSFRKPITWACVIAAVVAVSADNAMSRRVEIRGTRLLRWYGSQRYRRINYLTGVVLALGFIWLFADLRAEEVQEGQGDIVTAVLADETRRREAILLGTTAQFVLLYDPGSRTVFIHPHENVSRLIVNLPE